PYLSLGCSCDVDLYSAIKKAIFEAQKSRIWIRQEILLNPKEFLKFKDNMNFTNLVQRGFFWANKKNKKYLDFIFNSKKKYELKSQHKVVKNKFNTIINYLKHNNYSIYVADLRPEFLSKTNIYINKVIIPELQPLYLYENFKYDIGKNLKKKLNKIPHPFL
ncbi:MAG: YcaO-like family protein, partial [bacterium]